MPSVKWLLGPTLLLSLASGCVKRPVDYQREYARTLRPVELGGPAGDDGVAPVAPRILLVRAWVDEDFQAQTPHWRERVAEQIRRANRVLEPQFGCRLQVVSVAPWKRAIRPSELAPSLDQLRDDDPGRDVDLVIGYVSAVRMPTALTEALGMAVLGGRHLVLRAMVFAQEVDQLERVLDLLPVEERSELDRQRRVHREVIILLHEWAHLYGAPHESHPSSIMAAEYHQQAVAFSPASVQVIQAALASGQAARAIAAPTPSFDTPPPPMAPPPAASPAFPGVLPARLRPGPPPPAPERPRSTATSTGVSGRRSALVALAAREASLSSGDGSPAAWLQVAQEADELGAPALTERAARRAGAAPIATFLVADARRRRRAVALPLDGAVAAEREPAYVEEVDRVLHLSADRRPAEARTALRALEAAFPGTPGPALGACAVAVAERGPASLASCTAAVEAFAESPRARVLLGVVLGRAGRWPEARDRFRQALALDESTGEAWERLAAALVELRETAALRELEVRHQARFGTALQPRRDER